MWRVATPARALKGRNSGGVFLTTIHKFTEDTELLTERTNVICISDEAHRSQVNLDQKVKVTDEGVKRTLASPSISTIPRSTRPTSASPARPSMPRSMSLARWWTATP